MVAILRVTDGTDHVDMLGPAAYRLRSWRPSKAPIKGGGVWQSSPLADGRRLVAYRWDNLMDTFTMDSFGGTQDDLIRITQDAERLLVKALDYWTAAWQNEPVWIEAKADRETNARYAVLKAYDFANYSGPYEQPFTSCPPSFDELILVLEHGPWLANAPGESEAVEVSGARDYYDYTAMGRDTSSTPGAANDDCYVTMPTGTITLAGNSLLVGRGNYSIGCRFIDLAVPNGALIALAYIDPLERIAIVANTGDVVYSLVRGELDANPAIFAAGAAGFLDFITRPRTVAYVPWTHVEPWTAAAFSGALFIPNCKNVVQEIVNLPGWVSGQNLAVFIEDNISSAAAMREFCSQEEGNPFDLYVAFVANPAANTWTFGRAANAVGESFVSNHFRPGNLTHVYRNDVTAVPPADYVQLLNDAGGYDLLPNPLTAGDMVYFGIALDAVYPGGFCSLVFDLNPAIAVDDCEIVWERGGGGAWPALFERDNTNEFLLELDERPFTQAGVMSVHWESQAAAAFLATVNLIPGYWVRARIIAAPSAGVPPRQVNRDVYAIEWPNVHLAATEILGDIPSLLHLQYHNWADGYSTSHSTRIMPDFRFNHLMVSTRTTSRGAGFIPFIHLADQDLPTGISVMPGTASLAGTQDTCNIFVTGVNDRRMLQAPSNANTTLTSAWIQFNGTKADEYTGTFRVFFRVYSSDTDSDYIQLKLYGWANETGGPGGVPLWVGDQISLDSTLTWQLMDFGKVTIPKSQGDYSALVFEVICSKTATDDVYMADLILMPVDEWSGEFSQTPTYGSCEYGQYLDIDSIGDPKTPVIATLRQEDTAELVAPWKVITNGPAALQANAEQDLWFLAWYEDSDGGLTAKPHISGSIQVFKNDRYLGMRGAR